jgi:MSHA biogenesis protein MshN
LPSAATARQASDDAAPGGGSSPPAPASEKAGGEPTPQVPLSIDKKIRPPTPEEQAEREFRRGLAALQRHRDGEAMGAFRSALERNPRHETARQSLVALLLAGNRLAEAESALAEGLALNPRQIGFATALARIQVERGATAAALDTLAAVAPYGGASAEFEAFFAALLHRAGRHREAAERYARALQMAPGTGVWLLGMGLALQADGRPAEARAAFEQARASRQLSAELAAFVEQRLGQLTSN